VVIWDNGRYEVLGDAVAQLKAGRLRFRLYGKRLQGEFSLVRMSGRDGKQWLLIKSRDEFADADWKLETVLPTEKT
jgi:bifunctional non-homologous end joining protein LigD